MSADGWSGRQNRPSASGRPPSAEPKATTRTEAGLPLSRSKRRSGLSCEIASDLRPNSFSHDWHVQPDCQRPNRHPPERRAFSPAGRLVREPDLSPGQSSTARPQPTRQHPTVLETLQTYRAAKNPVNPRTAQICTGFPHRKKRAASDSGELPVHTDSRLGCLVEPMPDWPLSSFLARNSMAFRLESA